MHFWWCWHPDHICWSALSGCTSWHLRLHQWLYRGSCISVGSRSITTVINRFYTTTPRCVCSSCAWLLVQIELPSLDYSKHQWSVVSSRGCHPSVVSVHHDSPILPEQDLFSFPISLGGLRICDPYHTSGENYKFSYVLSHPLVI